MVRFLVVLVVGCCALAPAASAATTVSGVTVRRVQAGNAGAVYVATFSERAYRRVAGRWVRFGCLKLKAGEPWAGSGEAEATTLLLPRTYLAPRLEVPQGYRPDSCYLRTAKGRPIEVPLTALGRRHVEERRAFALLMSTLAFTTTKSGAPATVAQAVAAGRGFVVALPGPDAAPAADHGGYWREGERFVAATVTRDGRRMFLELAPGRVLRTNAFEFLNADDDGCSEDGAVRRGSGVESCAEPLALGFA